MARAGAEDMEETEATARVVAAMAATRVQVGMEAAKVGAGDTGLAGAEAEGLGTKAGLDTRTAGMVGEVTGCKTTDIRPSVDTTTRPIATRSARVTSLCFFASCFSPDLAATV